MSTVSIGIRKFFEAAPDGPGGAVVNIIPLAGAQGERLSPTEKSTRRRDNLIAPIGQTGTHLNVELPSGQYLARVALPSGEWLEKQFEANESLPVLLDFEAQPSRHEWLSWQHFSGGTDSRPTNVQMRASPMRSTRTGAQPKAAFPRTEQSDLQQALAAFDTGLHGDGPFGGEKLWAAMLRGKKDEGSWERFGNEGGPGCWSARLAAVDREDPEFRLLRTSAQDGRWAGRTQNHWRNFLVARTVHALEIATVPLQWRALGSSPGFTAEVLLHKKVGSESYLTRSGIADTISGSMISYMAQGRSDLALPFVDHARELLFDKQDNPLGAAAGGYVLLANASAAGDTQWSNWTGRLMSIAPWLPDAAILHGIRALRLGTSEAEFREAGDKLLSAFRRGPPFFSMGVVLLQEGLSQVAGEWQQAEMVAALKVVDEFAARLDCAQPFTTLRFARTP
jgi:hypothetical protein